MVHMETRTVLLERGARGWSILNDGGSVAVDGAVVRALTLGLGQVKAEPAAGADRGLQLAVITMENEAGRKEILTFWERRGGGLLVKRATADGLLLAVPVSTLDIAKTALATTGR